MAEEKTSLRDALELSYDEHVSSSEKEKETEEKPQEDSPVTASDAPAETSETAPEEGKTAVEAETKTPQPEAASKSAVTAPVFWAKEDKAEFSKLPPKLQERIALREKQRDQYIDRLASGIQRERKLYEGLNEVFSEDRLSTLRVSGLTPIAATQRLWAWHDVLESNPLKGIAELAKRYGVDMNQLSGVEVEPEGDSRVRELERQIEDLKAQHEQSREETEVSAVRSQLDAFAAEKDERGTPLRPYFNDLKPAMRQLLPLVYQENPGITDYEALHQAYERAAYASPNIRQNLLKPQQPSRPNNADSVRKAAVSLTGSPSPGASSSQRPKSVRDALRYAAAKHGVEME